MKTITCPLIDGRSNVWSQNVMPRFPQKKIKTRTTLITMTSTVMTILLVITGTIAAHAATSNIRDAFVAVNLTTQSDTNISFPDLKHLDITNKESLQLGFTSPRGHTISMSVGDDLVTEAAGAVVGGEQLKAIATSGSLSYVLTKSNKNPGAIFTVMHDQSDSVGRFEIAVDGKPATLHKGKNGAVVIADDAGQIENVIQPAWARDKRGNQVETRYDVDGSTLIQTIVLEGDEVFPIVGGGVLECDWFFCTVEMNRDDTRFIANLGSIDWLVTLACGFLAVGGGWPTAICAAAIQGISNLVQGIAAEAYDQGKCFGIRAVIYAPGATLHPVIYGPGGNCY